MRLREAVLLLKCERDRGVELRKALAVTGRFGQLTRFAPQLDLDRQECGEQVRLQRSLGTQQELFQTWLRSRAPLRFKSVARGVDQRDDVRIVELVARGNRIAGPCAVVS